MKMDMAVRSVMPDCVDRFRLNPLVADPGLQINLPAAAA
jgi:hypothetical protein